MALRDSLRGNASEAVWAAGLNTLRLVDYHDNQIVIGAPNQIQLLTLISPAGVYEKSAFVQGATNHFAGINVGPIDYPHARSFGDLAWYDQGFARRMISEIAAS